MNLANITATQILDIINTGIPPFAELKKNYGIYETEDIQNNSINISIGVSYEDDDDDEEVYIYNVFIDGEYINIASTGNKEDKLPVSVIDEILDVLSKI